MGRRRYTIAVDFDGVLHRYDTPFIAPHVIPDGPVAGALEWLEDMVSRFDVAVVSTRCSTWRGRRAMRRWLWQWDSANNGGLFSDYSFWKARRPLGQVTFPKRKPPALIYLDDRAVRFEGPGTFPSKEDVHRLLPWHKRLDLEVEVP